MAHKILRGLILFTLVAGIVGGVLAQEPDTVDTTALGGLSQDVILLIVAAALIPLIIVGVGIFVFVRVIQPGRRIAPFYEAIELVKNKNYKEALPKLSEVEGRLPDDLRRQARFFVAFCYMMLDNLEQAQAQFTALHSEDGDDLHVVYALAYIHVTRKQFEKAVPFLDTLRKRQWENYLHTKKLLALVAVYLGNKALSENRFDSAAAFFSEVSQYGEFVDAIPSNLRNRQSVLGTQALHDGDVEEARAQFENLRDSLSDVPSDERNEMEINIYLGLALVTWLETPEAFENIDETLTRAAKLIDANAPLESNWAVSVETPDLATQVDALEDSTEDDKVSTSLEPDKVAQEIAGANKLMRDIHFLRGMAVLRAWRQLDGNAAHGVIQEKLHLTLSRLARVYEIDPEFATAVLVVGLLKYYFYSSSEAEHGAGIDLLKLSQRMGMNDPETRKILLDIEKRDKERRDATDQYIWLLDKYLNDATVKKEIRITLLGKLAAFQRIQDWDNQPDLADSESVEPTLADMRRRSEMLKVRVEEMLRSRQEKDDAVQEIEKKSKVLQESSEALQQHVTNIQNQEAELLEVTGNELLKD